MKSEFIFFIRSLQIQICDVMESIDGKAIFKQDVWQSQEGGGGLTNVIANGSVFEKGGVNTSVVHGILPKMLQKKTNVEYGQFMACGLSLVLHPLNPFVPTVHANFRYFELYDQAGDLKDSWFGGGIDLTPYYLEESDGSYFHRTLKEACDPFGAQLYPMYKENCDRYFVNSHRCDEARGIGGIFYDYQRPDYLRKPENLFAFSKACANAFLKAYIPLLIKHKDTPFTEEHRRWQAHRRGRYVEFNLIHDKGTLFGIQTGGRTDSILISLPPIARWDYDFHPDPGSPEEQLMQWLKPRDWINV
ncbi:oxygen-dependent coproporphyrinogen oxidase [Chryseobacterium rhizoplanae]|nr:oxygen-dependent coproporphyrinogen oxidase [Chryseobacterium rhizoplanae]UCA62178.1 oxygen-dependent coproporphyrinogen oxidase [Chryseobacterium rhizoplanae]